VAIAVASNLAVIRTRLNRSYTPSLIGGSSEELDNWSRRELHDVKPGRSRRWDCTAIRQRVTPMALNAPSGFQAGLMGSRFRLTRELKSVQSECQP
jgi:hypothetical protein